MLTTAQALHSRARTRTHTHALTETYIFAALSFLLPSGQRVFKVALTQATTLNPAAKLKGETGPGKGGGLSLTAFLFLFLRVLPRGGKIFKSLERGEKKKKKKQGTIKKKIGVRDGEETSLSSAGFSIILLLTMGFKVSPACSAALNTQS